jgi:hypothetical protein
MKICGCKKAKSAPGLGKDFGPCEKHYRMYHYGSEEERTIASRYTYPVRMSRDEWRAIEARLKRK